MNQRRAALGRARAHACGAMLRFRAARCPSACPVHNTEPGCHLEVVSWCTTAHAVSLPWSQHRARSLARSPARCSPSRQKNQFRKPGSSPCWGARRVLSPGALRHPSATFLPAERLCKKRRARMYDRVGRGTVAGGSLLACKQRGIERALCWLVSRRCASKVGLALPQQVLDLEPLFLRINRSERDTFPSTVEVSEIIDT